MNVESTIPNFIFEYNNFSFSITTDPEQTDTIQEIVKRVSITPQISQESVQIALSNSQQVIQGVYKDAFTLHSGALKTINRDTKQISLHSSFKELPKTGKDDCFYFKPPRQLDLPIHFDVTVIYDKKITQSQSSEGSSTTQQTETWERDLTFNKRFSTVIKGQWDIWAKAFREYLKNYSS